MASYCTSVLLKLANHDDHLARANDWVAKDSDESKAGTLNPGQVSYYNQTGETFKIAAIRTVLNDLAYAGFRGQKRWCVLLHFDKATIPAQNAILKLLEEPPADTQIVLTVSQTEKLLPTVVSRCVVTHFDELNQVQASDTNSTADAEMVLQQLQAGSYTTAIDLANQFKDRAAAAELLQALATHLSQRAGAGEHHRAAAATETLIALKNLDQNLNPTLVLEHCFFKLISLSK